MNKLGGGVDTMAPADFISAESNIVEWRACKSSQSVLIADKDGVARAGRRSSSRLTENCTTKWMWSLPDVDVPWRTAAHRQRSRPDPVTSPAVNVRAEQPVAVVRDMVDRHEAARTRRRARSAPGKMTS